MVVPNQVTGLFVTPKNGEAFLRWDIPDDNGDPITNYEPEFKLTASGTFIPFENGTAPISSATINNLTNDVSYDFQVRAINASGNGSYSATVSATPVSGDFTEIANVLLILKDHGTDVDLSQFWTVIEYEDAVPQALKVTLPTSFGDFLTRNTKIQKFDRIYCRITDIRGNILEDVFHVRKIKRSRKGGKGKKLQLICPHQSEHLWKRNISILSRRISGREVVDEVVEQLNDSNGKGTNDPDVNTDTTFDPVTKKGVDLDDGTSNIYKFEKKKLQEVFDKVIDTQAQLPEGGGSFQPFYIRFKSDYDHDANTDLDQVSIQAYPQGFVFKDAAFANIPKITLKHGITGDVTTNTLENDSDEDSELATNIHLVGGQKAGDLLGDYSKYFGALNTFRNAKTWNDTDTFREGTLDLEDGVTYEAIAESTNQQPQDG